MNSGEPPIGLAYVSETLKKEIAELKQTEALLQGQNRVLEMMAAGAPLPESLAALVQLIEARDPGMLCSILLLDKQGVHLRHGAAPSLPLDYVKAIDGGAIGPDVGSCGAAAYLKEPVIVGDIRSDPIWEKYRAIALQHGLRACWSTPIFDEQHSMLGTFAMYYRQPALPEPEHLRLIEMATHIAAIAISRDRSQAALRESESQLRLVVNTIPAMAWIVLPDGSIDFVNRRWLEYTGISLEEAIKNPTDAIHPEDHSRVMEKWAKDMAAELPVDDEMRLRRADGEYRWFLVRTAPMRDERGKILSWYGMSTDIEDRKRADQALRESKQLLDLMLATLPVGVSVTNRAGDIVLTNAVSKQIWGNLIVAGRDRWAQSEGYWHHSGRRIEPGHWASVRALSKGQTTLNELIDIVTFDGRKKTIQNSTAPIRDAEGGIVGAVIVNEDVTERVRAEELLRAREEEIRAIVENSPDLIVRFDRNLRRTYVNPAFIKANELPAESLLGREIGSTAKDGVVNATEEEVAVLRRSLQWVHDHVHALEFETTWPMPAGRRSFAVHMQPELDAQGVLTSIVVLFRDITKVKDAERQLLALAENSPDIIARLDREGRYLYVNRRIEELAGIPAGELLGELVGAELAARLDPDTSKDFLAHRRAITQVLATGEPMDLSFSLPLGRGERIVNVRLVPERDHSGEIVSLLAIGRDITERQRALDALRESEQRFREVTESIDEVFWLRDAANNEVIYVSPAYEKVWGRSCESLYRAHRSWLDSVDCDDFERVEKAAERQLEGDYDVEYRIVRPDGSVRWVHYRAFPIRDSAGRIYRIAGVADDITAHRELEQQLRQSQKMEAFGQLAGGIAHDFNNLLGVIQMHSSLLLDEEEMSPPVKSSLQDIMAAAERAGGLTRQLLTFSRREVTQARDLELGEVIDAMIKLLRRILGEDIAIETRFASPLPLVHADPGMVEQVIMNLAVNARDAMPNGGRLSVSLEPVEIASARVTAHPGVLPGPFVCLSVSDTGSGMPPEIHSRIFEPFFTTKEVGKGTGLGLATVFGIAEQHRGWIEVESEVNRGTTFRVFLPALARTAPALAAEPIQPRPRDGNEGILLVEDEDALRVITRIVLEQHGYRVFPAPTPAAALEVWASRRSRINLLLTDLIMPGGMSGRELTERLLADEPNLKVIYTSGYSEDIVSRHLHLDPGRAFLQKPCSSISLLTAVRRCLDEKRA